MVSDVLNRIKIIHLLDVFPPSSVSQIVKAIKDDPTLTPEQRATVSELARSLRDRGISSRLSDVMVHLICLACCRRRNRDGSEIIVLPVDSAKVSETLHVAELTVKSVLEILTSFNDLTPSDQLLLLKHGQTDNAAATEADPVALYLGLSEARTRIGNAEFQGQHVSEYLDLTADDGHELAHRDSRLSFLGIASERLHILMCQRCICYAPVFSRVDLTGGATWSALNVRPDFIGRIDDYPPLPQHSLVLGPRDPSPVVATFVESSHLGGYPGWFQDADYPPCPSCDLPMPFVGQVAWDDVDPPNEGITYAFFCPDCRVTASSYQQT